MIHGRDLNVSSPLRDLCCHIALGAVASWQHSHSPSHIPLGPACLDWFPPGQVFHYIRVVHTLWEMWLPPRAPLHLYFWLHNVIQKYWTLCHLSLYVGSVNLLYPSQRDLQLCVKNSCVSSSADNPWLHLVFESSLRQGLSFQVSGKQLGHSSTS